MAFECANGRSIGFASWPYPPATARCVDQASNAAPLCPATVSAYQIFLCRGVSRGRVNTGFAARKGCAAAFGAIGSTSAFTLGAGAESRAEATSVESFVELSEATAGESLTTFAGSSICEMEQIKSSVAMTIRDTSVLPVGPASPSPLAMGRTYCTKGQATLVHWSHSD